MSGNRANRLNFKCVFCYFFFNCPQLQHMEVPRPGAEYEPQLQPMAQMWQCLFL